MWILRHALAILVLPFTVTILIPLWIGSRHAIPFRPPASAIDWLSVALGIGLLLGGLTLFVSTIFLFATRGRGTLAPWDPPKHLVILGPYRYVRNPMISGVLLVLAGESLVLRSSAHATWFATFLLLCMIFIPLFEEPQLERRFGESYRIYRKNVRGFLPRLTPWKGEQA